MTKIYSRSARLQLRPGAHSTLATQQSR